MIVAFGGSLGSGKTLAMVQWALRYSLAARGASVWANFDLHEAFFREHRQMNPAFQLGRIRTADDIIRMTEAGGGLLLLDEVHRLLDSRLAMQTQNIFLSELFMFFRKMGVTLLVSFQTARMVDVRLRNCIDLYVWCLKRGPRGNRIYERHIYDWQYVQPRLLRVERYTESEVQPLYAAYDTYQFIHGFAFPRTQREFDKFMERLERAALKARGVNEHGSDGEAAAAAG